MTNSASPTLRVILGPRGRRVLSWVVALVLTVILGLRAWHAFDGKYMEAPADRERADGNLGHALIDFGGQWLMGRMLIAGHGHELYLADVERDVLRSAYPRADEGPDQTVSDADRLWDWLVSAPPAYDGEPPIRGALYPPVHALLFAPLGTLEPRPAYRFAQFTYLGLTWLAGAAFSSLSRRRVWWPLATSVLMIFPGYMGTVYLAQNSALSLTILLCGWWLMARGRPALGGATWGLLAYKPTWALAFLLVPLLTRRWRMLAGMIGVGTILGMATLPFVGITPWLHWLRIGREAAAAYNVDDNWILLGRDLLGVPRRWLIDFHEARELRDRLAAAISGWSLLLGVVVTTAFIAWRRPSDVSGSIGTGAAFVGLGAWASCFHFIYYDSLLAAFPFALLLCDTDAYLRPIRAEFTRDGSNPAAPPVICWINSFDLNSLGFLVLAEQFLPLLKLDLLVTIGALPTGGRWPNPLLFSTKQAGTPWDTLCLLIVWAYCGLRVVRANHAAAR